MLTLLPLPAKGTTGSNPDEICCELEHEALARYWSRANCTAVAESSYWSRRWVIRGLVLAKEVEFHRGVGYFTLNDYSYEVHEPGWPRV